MPFSKFPIDKSVWDQAVERISSFSRYLDFHSGNER